MRALLFPILLSLPLALLAQNFPERSNRLVTDYTNTLTLTAKNDLESKLVAYSQESSVQIAIVIIQKLDGYEISQYAFELGEKWGIGQSGTDNGALILVSMDDRKMWIATGYGLEATVTDALCKRIIENEMKPRFRKGDFAGGLQAASEAIILASRGEYLGQGNGSGNEEKTPAGIIILVVGAILIFWAIFWLIAALEAKKYARINGLSFWAAWALLNASRSTHTGSWSSFSGGSGGFGGFSGGGSSFGGFGGGSFGGGGAGGSW